MHQHAYDEEDGPAIESIQRFKQVALHHVPLRKNSKLLAKEEAKQAASSRGGFDGVAGMDIGSVLRDPARMLQQNPLDSAQGFNLRIIPSPGRGAGGSPAEAVEDETALAILPRRGVVELILEALEDPIVVVHVVVVPEPVVVVVVGSRPGGSAGRRRRPA